MALVAVACSGGSGESSTTASSTTTTEAVAPSSGASTTTTTTEPASAPAESVVACEPPRLLPVGRTDQPFEYNGTERGYSLFVPASYDGSEPLPVVFDFHGRGSDKNQEFVYSGFEPLAERDGWLLVHPNATGDPRQWNPASFVDPSYDDLEFLDVLVEEIEGRACVDSNRRYATGMSSGALMTGALACQRGDRFAAFAGVTFELWDESFCSDTRTAPVFFFHGTDDDIVAFDGGEFGEGALGASEAWARHNGCASDPTEEVIGSEVRRLEWDDCDDPAEVVLYIIEGGGHTWPGSFEVPGLGMVTDDISATQIIWDLFGRHALT